MSERTNLYPELFYDWRRAALDLGALAETDRDAAKRLARKVSRLIEREREAIRRTKTRRRAA